MREQGTRRRLRGRRFVVWGVAAALLLGLLALAPSHVRFQSALVSAAGAAAFQVSAENGFMFSPNEISNVATNTTVTVTIVNGDPTGTLHTFTISSVQGTELPSTADIGMFFAKHPPMFSKNLTSIGEKITGNFTAPAKGWYEFVCQEPGHFQNGMFGFIAFGESLPSNLTTGIGSVGPGAAVFIITGTIVALVVIAIVLGFVVGRRRGGVHEMAPERLGYPEPELPPPPGPPPSSPSRPNQ